MGDNPGGKETDVTVWPDPDKTGDPKVNRT